MPSAEDTDAADAEAALAETWAAELVTDPDADFGQTVRPPEDTLDETALPTLQFSGTNADYVQRGVLGEGGMAVVHAAWQRALDREVAIKRTRGARGQRAAMVREARVVGGLEHPSIVPVHALGRDEDGQTVIVMQRVSGESWLALLRDPEHALWGTTERLQRNLEILIAVCHAVELAHSRGWLHRDLKSENIMLGEFGEVYVLDWGIAVPRALAEKGEAVFAGTPLYMAPEMAVGGVLTVQTDIFLLGAILYEVVVGHAPNKADSLRDILNVALTPRAWKLPDDTPDELAAIVRRALAFHPSDRFEDVAALRTTLAGFLVHRDAVHIANRAAATLESDEGPPRPRLNEALFALRQSLALWDDNPRALASLRRCLERLARLELEEGNPSSAAMWAEQIDPRDEALEADIEASRQALAETARELESLRGYAAERDLGAGAAERRRRAFIYTVLVLVVGGMGGQAVRAGWMELGFLQLGALYAVLSAIAIAGSRFRFAQQNLVSRSIARVMAVASVTPFFMLFAAWRLDLPAEVSLALDGFVKAGGSLVLGITLDPVFFWSMGASVLMAVTLLCFPGTYPVEIATVGTAIAVALVGSKLDIGGSDT